MASSSENPPHPKTFADYKSEAHRWVTLSQGTYYPDTLKAACDLYAPVLQRFRELLTASPDSVQMFLAIAEEKEQWNRVQLARVFKKYVSPSTPVEMLKRKADAKRICDQFGELFRPIKEVQQVFGTRPHPDEALCALLWEYKDRGKKGYDLTERFFAIINEALPHLRITGPVRAGQDILMKELFGDYPNAFDNLIWPTCDHFIWPTLWCRS